MSTARWLVPSLLVALLSGCALFTQYGRLTSTAKRSFESGDYGTAVTSIVNALKIKPEYKAAQDLAPTIIPQSRQRLIDRIGQMKRQAATFVDDNTVTQREQVLGDCRTLVKVMQSAASLPPYVQISTGQTISFTYEDYTSWVGEAERALADAKQQAAEQHYSRGVQLSSTDSREASRQAAAEFKKSLAFVPNYKDAMMRYLGARSAGTLQVGLLGVDTEAAWPLGASIGDPLGTGVMTGLAEKGKDLEFTVFVDRDTVSKALNSQMINLSAAYADDRTAADIGKQLGLDQVLVITVTRLDAPDPQVQPSQKVENGKVQNGYTYYTDANGQQQSTPKYDNVQAVVTTNVKQATTTVAVSYKLIGTAKGNIVDKGQVTGANTWKSGAWGTYTGDARALSAASRQLTQTAQPANPDKAACAVDAAKDAVNKIVSVLAPRFK